MSSEDSARYNFLITNLLKGMMWLTIILALFLLVKSYFEADYDILMSHVSDKPTLVLTIFTASEILFGIIPPELFMIWSLQQGTPIDYALFVLLFAVISYLSGLLGYFIGLRFSKTTIYCQITGRLGSAFEGKVKKYGGLMIFIGAVTPVPFSAICMLSGAARYDFYYFLIISISRIARFALYAYVVWEVNLI